MSCVLLIPP